MRKIRGHIFSGVDGFCPGEITTENNIITNVEFLLTEDLSEEEAKLLVIPGLVDVHSHGCFGHDVCEASESELLGMLEFQRSMGVTSYFPTTMTFPEDKLTEACKRVARVAKLDRTIKGIYLEGPFISAEKCGAQKKEYIMDPDYDMLQRLQAAADGLIKFVAIAPEKTGAMDCIEKGKEQFCFSLAHSMADYDTAIEAFEKGARQVTHLFNAMPAYNHREPGLVGAAMDCEEAWKELICDGNHIHPAVIRNCFKQFGTRIVLISDSMEGTGLPEGEYMLGGQKVFVKDKKALLANGTLAGSVSTLFECMKNAVKIGISLEEAITACTENPARVAGIYDRVGSIERGKNADLVVLDRKLSIIEVICNNR